MTADKECLPTPLCPEDGDDHRDGDDHHDGGGIGDKGCVIMIALVFIFCFIMETTKYDGLHVKLFLKPPHTLNSAHFLFPNDQKYPRTVLCHVVTGTQRHSLTVSTPTEAHWVKKIRRFAPRSQDNRKYNLNQLRPTGYGKYVDLHRGQKII